MALAQVAMPQPPTVVEPTSPFNHPLFPPDSPVFPLINQLIKVIKQKRLVFGNRISVYGDADLYSKFSYASYLYRTYANQGSPDKKRWLLYVIEKILEMGNLSDKNNFDLADLLDQLKPEQIDKFVDLLDGWVFLDGGERCKPKKRPVIDAES